MTQIVVFQPKYSKITKKYFVPLSLASSSPSITYFVKLQSHLDLPSPTLPFPPTYRAFFPSPNCTADRRMTVFARLIIFQVSPQHHIPLFLTILAFSIKVADGKICAKNGISQERKKGRGILAGYLRGSD